MGIKNIKKYLIKESFVLTIIVINALSLFLGAFPKIDKATFGTLYWVDYCCTIYFFIEMFIKISIFSWRGYWASGWNRFDFFVVVLSGPSLLDPIIAMKAFSAILILRLARLARFFKFFRVIPEAPRIWAGILRALKASLGVFLALFGLNLILSMGATLLFGHIAPEYFGDPLKSIYSLFKVFTVEGWYEIPDLIANRTNSTTMLFIIRGYFIFSVLIGGILGLSLANAVFVEEMTLENTNRVESMVEELGKDVSSIKDNISEIKTKLYNKQQ